MPLSLHPSHAVSVLTDDMHEFVTSSTSCCGAYPPLNAGFMMPRAESSSERRDSCAQTHCQEEWMKRLKRSLRNTKYCWLFTLARCFGVATCYG